MGLFDFLSGNPGGMDAMGMGPPAPAQPGLLDRLGGMLGGGNGAIDPALAAQLGLDPDKLKHQQAQAVLMRFLAAAASAPGRLGHNASVGDSIAAGMQGALGAPNVANDQIRQALLGAQVKRQTTQAAREDQQLAQSDALAKSLQSAPLDPKFVEAMGVPEATLKLMPPDKLASMVMSWNSGNAADARAAAHEEAAAARQQAQFQQQLTMQDRIAQRQLAAGNRLPAELAMLPLEQQLAAVRAKYGINADANGNVIPAPSKADLAATDKRLGVLQDTVTRNSNLSDRIGAMIAGIQDGTFNTGDSSITGRAARAYNEHAPPFARSDALNQFDKNANDLVTQYLQTASTGGTRGSVALLKQIQSSKPSVGQSTETNLKILSDMKADLDARLARAGAEMSHYQNGGSIRSWGGQGIPGADSGGSAVAAPAATSSGGMMGAAPAPAIAHLKQHPELAAAFDAKYGAGAAAAILGQ